jgi:hypothetical protein
MRGARLVLAGAVLALAAGCGSQQLTRASAERLCADEARLADGVAGNIGIGVGSGGGRLGGGGLVTSDVLNPRAERDVLEACVARRMAGDNRPARRPGLTIGIEGSVDTDL